MVLEHYREKRDFSRTPEPQGERRTDRAGNLYVVQKHAARRLHYDFRLEIDGVLKSWALPKGPSLDPGVKSLAVHVEDHPLEYGWFEGTIPEGEYGGGTVMLWDRGTWEPEGDPVEGYKQGKLRFRLVGEKLRGRWTLVRMGGHKHEQENHWLLIKRDDADARPAGEYDLLQERPDSVATGRSMDQIAADADRVWTDGEQEPGAPDRRGGIDVLDEVPDLPGARRGHPPRTLEPELATLAKEAPRGDRWLHELKFDGYRILAHLEEGRARLRTRRGNDWTERFPEIARAIEKLPVREAVLDGEIVALAADGSSDFQALQNSMKSGRREPLVYYAFDLPFVAGYDLRRTPLVERKRVLDRLLRARPEPHKRIRYSDHVVGRGREMYERSCRYVVEGIVSKRADSPYESRRSRDWLKVKCLKRQEFVIGGYTAPSGGRRGFGSLVLGYYDDDGRLVYCGRVGTGFNAQSLEEIAAELDERRTRQCPFDRPPTGAEAKGVHWVEPQLVAEVEFSQWTNDGRLRSPSFKGLREDKPAREVKREEPPIQPQANGHGAAGPRDGKSVAGVKRSRPGSVRVAGVTLTHPDRVLYPEQGLTKRELAEFYVDIADWILPHVVGRPLTLVRCPSGRHEACFYQKHVNESVPDEVRGIEIEEKQKKRTYLMIEDLAGLVALVQLGVLEVHPWGCRADRIERPDRLVFDLDPGERVEWAAVVEAAREVRELLAELGLESFVRTSGGKGLHVVAPLERRQGWDELKQFAKAVAQSLQRRAPERYIATASKARRQGKVFVDYLRNGRGATAIASYSTRALPRAPVAAPLRWDELSPSVRADAYNVANLRRRLAALKADPWEGFDEVRQSISRQVREQVEVGSGQE